MSEGSRQQVVSGASVMAAGMASTLAAAVTSRFGVAGTILGAGITAMIVTGGAAILKAYLESAAGKVREMPSRMRRQNGEQTMERFGKDSKGSGFPARFRHALGWFSRLPEKNRKSILKRGLIGALGAFVICLVAVTLLELGIGNSLSCGLWGNCPVGATPGPHFGANRQLGAGSSATFGRPKVGGAAPVTVPGEQGPSLFGGEEQPTPSTASPQPDPSTSTASPQPDPSTDSPQPDPSTSTASPQTNPSTSTANPQPDPSTASPQADPSTASPQADPSTASPRAAPQAAPSTASPQAAPSE